MKGEKIFFDDQGGSNMRVVDDEVSPCILACNLQKGHSLICVDGKRDVIAFAQNTREEVRVLGTDGNVAGCVSAESGSHQTTYLCVRKKGESVPRGTTAKQLTVGRGVAGGGDRFVRAGSYGMFEVTNVSGTLDCLHMSGVGNGTPCLVIHNAR